MKRALASLLIITGILGGGLCVGGIVYGYPFIDSLYDDLDNLITASAGSLEAVNRTLTQGNSVIEDSSFSLQNINETLDNIGQALEDSIPIFTVAEEIAVQQVPNGIDKIREGLGNIRIALQLLNVMLERLSNVEVDLPGILPSVKLGFLYNPDTPIYEPIDGVNKNLQQIAGDLRNLQEPFDTTETNLTDIRVDVLTISGNAQSLKQNIDTLKPQIDNLITTVTELKDRIERPQANIPRNRNIGKISFTLILVWIGCVSLASLLGGVHQLRSQRTENTEAML